MSMNEYDWVWLQFNIKSMINEPSHWGWLWMTEWPGPNWDQHMQWNMFNFNTQLCSLLSVKSYLVIKYLKMTAFGCKRIRSRILDDKRTIIIGFENHESVNHGSINHHIKQYWPTKSYMMHGTYDYDRYECIIIIHSWLIWIRLMHTIQPVTVQKQTLYTVYHMIEQSPSSILSNRIIIICDMWILEPGKQVSLVILLWMYDQPTVQLEHISFSSSGPQSDSLIPWSHDSLLFAWEGQRTLSTLRPVENWLGWARHG